MSKRAASLKAKGGKDVTTRKSGRSRAEPGPGLRKGKASTHEDREKGQNFYRDKNTIRRLQMYNKKPAKLAERAAQPQQQSIMIEPGRKWFNNTRVVNQAKLEQFRETVEENRHDPSSVMVKRTKLPVSLFSHDEDEASLRPKRSRLLALEPYEEIFSANRRRKKPRLAVNSLSDLAEQVESETAVYDEKKSSELADENDQHERKGPVEAVMLKGTSKRIWGELYKVVDSSDVIIQVLDARDPMGTRCYHLEKHIKNDRPFKHIVLLLNKCDLIPTSVTEKWVRILKKEFPTVAFKASLKKPFGKKALISVLRQFSELLTNRKHVSVGFIGYPNVGKSSVINTLKAKKVCSSAPIPGETKVWQYVALTSKVYLIDCPGIVASSGKQDGRNDVGKVLKGVVRAEKIETPEDYIDAIIEHVGKPKMNTHYGVADPWETAEQFLEILATKQGKLRKGGEPDISIMARKIIYDLQRGQLPYFVPPPKTSSPSTDTDTLADDTQKESD
eukprot:Gregarina_sp_Poly_1__4521@NODE_2428_length_2148_cov_134_987506_g623_i1_p1_GENE_NODE_2428_length_2148_cov_134_987506_g623_i1NODE_2428_length_2148_cov_134_987506_g623_i1_p1_ORF_typecomplete_len503_score74_19NGP1NT/PF08153_12/1_1e30MMR_HSR1/PF01926_23/97MMR_HSR1/PF01926_23/7_7e15RsgA_GTPase/PF03193_16/1_4e11FeoB_N/PF02421_18/0_2FeoB_N/PF02421_18/5e07GTP_EFTU/PF00009_27/0_076GTP_EFTU/PF00009_27/39MnmE_helical/PF12631_7/5_2e02MnmE_helical/PF12631_7/0_0014AIG1/PF04548_16/2e02AIG1/PF04548_16/0_015Arf/P